MSKKKSALPVPRIEIHEEDCWMVLKKTKTITDDTVELFTDYLNPEEPAIELGKQLGIPVYGIRKTFGLLSEGE